jgi:hypothetical protein
MSDVAAAQLGSWGFTVLGHVQEGVQAVIASLLEPSSNDQDTHSNQRHHWNLLAWSPNAAPLLYPRSPPVWLRTVTIPWTDVRHSPNVPCMPSSYVIPNAPNRALGGGFGRSPRDMHQISGDITSCVPENRTRIPLRRDFLRRCAE